MGCPEGRAAVYEQTQFGIENVDGTAVEANLLSRAFSIIAKPVEPTEILSGRGSKVGLAQVAQKGAHTMAPITGFQAFNDMVYLLALCQPPATITTPGGGVLSRDWLFVPKAFAADCPKAATFETGSAAGAGRFTYGQVTDLELSYSKTEAGLSGNIIGRRLAEEGVTLTATPTEIPLVPVSPANIDYFVASTVGDLPNGRLEQALDFKFNIGERIAAQFPLRSDQESFSKLVEKKNRYTSHIEVEHNSQSDAMLRQLRTRATRFGRILCTGPIIEGALRYELEITFPFKVLNPDRGDKDEIYGGMYDLEAIYDAVFGGFCKIRVRSTVTALAASTNLAAEQQPDALVGVALGGGGY